MPQKLWWATYPTSGKNMIMPGANSHSDSAVAWQMTCSSPSLQRTTAARSSKWQCDFRVTQGDTQPRAAERVHTQVCATNEASPIGSADDPHARKGTRAGCGHRDSRWIPSPYV